jgi:hypothetical protein
VHLVLHAHIHLVIRLLLLLLVTLLLLLFLLLLDVSDRLLFLHNDARVVGDGATTIRVAVAVVAVVVIRGPVGALASLLTVARVSYWPSCAVVAINALAVTGAAQKRTPYSLCCIDSAAET